MNNLLNQGAAGGTEISSGNYDQIESSNDVRCNGEEAEDKSSSMVTIMYAPTCGQKQLCFKMMFIQFAKTTFATLGGHEWGGFARGYRGGRNWELDWGYGGQPWPYYPWQRPYDISAKPSSSPQRRYVWMRDYLGLDHPWFYNLLFSPWCTQEFITCVVCVEGPDKGKVYGCTRWGHTLFGGKVTSRHPRRPAFGQEPEEIPDEIKDKFPSLR